VYLFAAVGAVVFSIVLLDTGSTPLIVLARVVTVNVFQAPMYGPRAAWIAELFPEIHRASIGSRSATPGEVG
jgi:hypothetical protein